MRFILFLISFGLTVVGLTYIITYLNLLSMGYTISEYFIFIINRIECIFAFIGFTIMTIIILKGENNDIHI